MVILTRAYERRHVVVVKRLRRAYSGQLIRTEGPIGLVHESHLERRTVHLPNVFKCHVYGGGDGDLTETVGRVDVYSHHSGDIRRSGNGHQSVVYHQSKHKQQTVFYHISLAGQ